MGDLDLFRDNGSGGFENGSTERVGMVIIALETMFHSVRKFLLSDESSDDIYNKAFNAIEGFRTVYRSTKHLLQSPIRDVLESNTDQLSSVASDWRDHYQREENDLARKEYQNDCRLTFHILNKEKDKIIKSIVDCF